MNTNIVISLDTRRAKKDGSYPLVMRLGHNERTTSIPLGISVEEKYWDAKNRNIRKSYVGSESVSRLNNLIQKKKAEAMDIIMKLHEDGKLNALSVTDLRDRIDRPNAALSFFSFADQYLTELKKANRIGTARSYKIVVDVLRGYCNGKDLPFAFMNYTFLQKFENSHRSKGNSANGLAVYMRTIKAIFNKAIQTGYAEREHYPFAEYKIKTVPTEKRALDWELLKRIIELDLWPDHPCFDTRNYFLGSYIMYGMNYTDMAFLKKIDLQNGRISYRRKKTSKIYDIKITPSLEEILSYYMDKNPDTEYVFPIIKRETPTGQYKDIEWARKRYNKKLKDLAKLCGIEQNLTSYVCRHSFATQAMMHEIPLAAISSMLGHSSMKTTQVYLKSLPSNMLDEYNSKLMQL